MKKYNSFLGAFFSGDNGQGGYNAAYKKSALASLYNGQLAPEQQNEVAANLSRVDPEAANKWQEDIVKQSANLLVTLGKDNPLAVQAWQTRIKPNLSRIYGAQADALPDVPDDNAFAIARQIAGAGGESDPGAVREFKYMTDGLTPQDREKARRIALGLDPRPSSAAIAYKEITGADGRKRLVAVDPRTPGAIIIDGSQGFGGSSEAEPMPDQPQPPSGRGGIVFPEDVAGAAQRTGDVMQQVRTEIAQLVAQGVPVADATSQVTQKYARMRGLTMPSQGQSPAATPRPVVSQRQANPGAFVSMSPAEEEAAKAEAKARIDLQYAPQVEGAKAMAKAQVEGQTAPQIEGAKAAAVETAKRSAISAADAPKFITTADQTLAVIDKAINHPGRAGATGMSAALPWQYAYGSKERDFITVSQQLEGKTFLQAFESLKGGGAITEMEGQAATKAIARLDRAQSEGEYLAALRELRQIVVDARNRAVQAARGNRAPAQPPAGGQGKSNYSSLWGD